MGYFKKGRVNSQADAKRIYDDLSSYAGDTLSSMDLTGLIGAPPTFSYLADPRLPGDNYGFMYNDKFIRRGTFAAVTVGKADFLPKTSGKEKDKVVSDLASGKLNEDDLSKTLKDYKSSQLYEFKKDMASYWQLVRGLITTTSRLIGVDEFAPQLYPGVTSFADINWGERASPFLQSMLSGTAAMQSDALGGDGKEVSSIDSAMWKFVPIYTDGILESDENVNSSTSKSMIEGMLNNNPLKNMSREMSAIAGTRADVDFSKFTTDDKDEKVSASDYITDNGLGGLFKSGVNTLNVNMKFPEVWQDSAYDKTYRMKIQLSTPYGDPLSVMNNIMIPLCHILPFGMPRQAVFSNAYHTPYIIKLFSRGHANTMLGMVTSMSIVKNPNTISINGLPTDISIELTIKDLMPMFAIPYETSKIFKFETTVGKIMSSAGLMNYLATISGYNVSDTEFLYELTTRIAGGARSEVKSLRETMSYKVTDYLANVNPLKYFKFIK